ncbi:MAG: nucleotidyltransferase domain-containing protein [Oligoflexia bacterium]|nr:nucleotidyltransferase domain-containing protein [Oligoflexia bacterium]
MSTPLKFGLQPKTVDALKSVFKAYSQIDSVVIYGSRAKGNYRNGSDIDLTIVAPALTLSDLLKIEDDIEELMLPYKVDLSLFHLIENPDVVEHIKRVGKKF